MVTITFAYTQNIIHKYFTAYWKTRLTNKGYLTRLEDGRGENIFCIQIITHNMFLSFSIDRFIKSNFILC